MHSLIKNIQQKTDMESFLYCIALSMIVIGAFVPTTLFYTLREYAEYLVYAGCLLMFIKIVIYQRSNQLQLLGIIGIIAAALLSGFLSDNYTIMFGLVMITTGAVNVPFRSIAKTYFRVASVLLIITVICSLTGVIENLQYNFETERGIRNSFGIIYPTDFAAHVLFIMLSFIIAYEEKLNIIHSLVGILVTIAVYHFCDTRIDCACMLLAWTGAPVIKVLKTKNIPAVLKKISACICTFSMPVGAVIMIILSAVYTSSSPLLSMLNQFLNGRLAWGREGFERYPVTLFGQQVVLVGAGGSTTLRDNYFFLDCSYMYCLMKYGVVITLMLIAAYVIIGMRHRHNGIILWIIAITALNCMIAHHLPDVAYIIFTAFVFSKTELSEFNNLSTQKTTAPDHTDSTKIVSEV